MKKIYYLIFSVLVATNLWAENQSEKLRFHKNGTFKIVQFTDTHFDYNSEKSPKTLATIKYVLDTEKPDFIIFTGDVVTTIPEKEGWLSLTKDVVASNIPWSVTFGNHDEENNLTKAETWALLQSLPNFVGEVGSVSGVGNDVLLIYDSKGKEQIKALLYLLDSHDYTHNPELGNYDWIKADQISWYRAESERYTRRNADMPIPALAFFHIPLLEYNEVANKKEFLGEKYEGIASAELNSGLFTAFVEKKDVMGVFVGHDHDNNYIGTLKNIALAFGQVTGESAYGDMERGARIIELREGLFSFKSWITTPSETKHVFHYPSGLSEVSDTTKLLPAQNVKPTKNGVYFKYYEGKAKKTADIDTLTVKKSGVITNFGIEEAEVSDHFAFRFEAWLKVPEDGYYKFFTYSDDGSVLLIDGQLVVDNDGGHSAKRENGMVALEAGFHKIEVLYFEDYMGEKLNVGISSISIPEGNIPNAFLFVD